MSSNLIDLIEKMRAYGATLRLNDQRKLMVGGNKQNLPDQLRTSLKEHKAELISLLSQLPSDHMPLTKADIADDYPVSNQQMRLYQTEIQNPGHDYHMIAAFRLSGELNLTALDRAFYLLSYRHESLRTGFTRKADETICQTIHPAESFLIQHREILPSDSFTQNADKLAKHLFLPPFDLTKPPLARALIQPFDDNSYLLIICLHHIICDGWSMGVFMQDLASLYDQALSASQDVLVASDFNYKDYALWQIQSHQSLEGQLRHRQNLKWWAKQCEGAPQLIDFPAPPNADSVDNSQPQAKSIRRAFSSNQQAKISDWAKTSQGTYFSVILTALQRILTRFTNQEDMIIGLPVANRHQPDHIDQLIGYFSNSLPIRLTTDPRASILDQLKHNARHVRQCWDHMDTPFDAIIDQIAPLRVSGRPPLAQIALAYQNAPSDFSFSGICCDEIPLDIATSKFELVFQIFERSDRFEVFLEYRSDLFSDLLAENLITALCDEVEIWDQPSVSSSPEQTILGQNEAFRAEIAPSLKISLTEDFIALKRSDPDHSLSDMLKSDTDITYIDEPHLAKSDNYTLLALGNDDPVLKTPLAQSAQHILIVGGWSFQKSSLPDRPISFILATTETGPLGYAAYINADMGALCIKPVDHFGKNSVLRHLIGTLSPPISNHGNIKLPLVRHFVKEQQICWQYEMPYRDTDILWHRGRFYDLQEITAGLCQNLDLLEGSFGSLAGHLVFFYVSSDQPPPLEKIKQSLGPLSEIIKHIELRRLPRTASGQIDHYHLSHASLGLQNISPRAIGSHKGIIVQQDIAYSEKAIHKWSFQQNTHQKTEIKTAPPEKITSEVSGTGKALSYLNGGAQNFSPDHCFCLPDLLENAVKSSGNLTYINEIGQSKVISYRDLQQKALNLLGKLQSDGFSKGDRFILMDNDAIAFFTGFWACLLGGMIPCPYIPPKTTSFDDGDLLRLFEVSPKIDARAVLSDQNLSPAFAHHQTFLPLISISENSHNTPGTAAPTSDSALAMMPFTSGSTGLPKAVMLSHQNMFSTADAILRRHNYGNDDTVLNWMPLEHAATITMLSMVAYMAGASQVHVNTQLILKQPTLWLNYLSKYRISHTWAPHFAFTLIGESQIDPAECAWDLSHVKCILNGGEAIISSGINRFIEKTAPFHLSSKSIQPCWGMSETSSAFLILDGITPEIIQTSSTPSILPSGTPNIGQEVRIVDHQGQMLPLGQEGAFEVKGSQVFAGYYNQPQETEESFTKDQWFRTGDRGKITEQGVVITGRDKEIIILNGLNFSQQAIEATLEEIDDLSTSYVAAIGAPAPGYMSECLIIFYHAPQDHMADRPALFKKIREKLREKMSLTPDFIIPLQKSDFPKTSIGKIQRTKLKQRFVKGQYDQIIINCDLTEQNNRTLPDWFAQQIWTQTTGSNSPAPLRFLIPPRQQNQRPLPDLSSLAQQGHWLALAETTPKDGDLVFIPDGEINSQLILLIAQWLKNFSGQMKIGISFVLAGRLNAIDPQTVPEPDGRALAAFLKSMLQEQPELKLRLLHLGLEESVDIQNWLPNLSKIGAVSTTNHAYFENIYFQGKLYRQHLQHLPDLSTSLTAHQNIDYGVFIITGANGRLGRDLIDHLRKHYQMPILAIGRRSLDDVTSVLGDFMSDRDIFQYLQIDMMEQCELDQIFDTAAQLANGKMIAVFHLAGSTEINILATEENLQSLQNHLQVKRDVTQKLCDQLTNKGGGTLFAFSSVNGFFGGYGAAAYSAANAALEQVCLLKNSETVTAVSLGWSRWKEGNDMPEADMLTRKGYHIINEKEGMTSLDYLLAQTHQMGPHAFLIGLQLAHPYIAKRLIDSDIRKQKPIYVSEDITDLPQMFLNDLGNSVQIDCITTDALPHHPDGTIDIQTLSDSLNHKKTAGTHMEASNPTEKIIAAIWQSLLGRSQIGIMDNFFDIGGNSITLARLSDQLNKQAGLTVSIADLFKYPTIRAQAGIATQSSQKTQLPDAQHTQNLAHRKANRKRQAKRRPTL